MYLKIIHRSHFPMKVKKKTEIQPIYVVLYKVYCELLIFFLFIFLFVLSFHDVWVNRVSFNSVIFFLFFRTVYMRSSPQYSNKKTNRMYSNKRVMIAINPKDIETCAWLWINDEYIISIKIGIKTTNSLISFSVWKKNQRKWKIENQKNKCVKIGRWFVIPGHFSNKIFSSVSISQSRNFNAEKKSYPSPLSLSFISGQLFM